MENLRIGNGYDVHKFAKGRKLYLGGVDIPYDTGLSGYSDADVVIHSICDSILGALSLPDIGVFFPNTDPKYKNVRSTIFLSKICDILKEHKAEIINIDCTILAEKPKIAPFSERMKETIASGLNIKKGQIGIKATTNEGLGFIGRGEGIACFASALILVEKL